MSKSPALVIAIVLQFIAIVLAFASFFLPIYRYKATGNVGTETVTQTVQLKYREYSCNVVGGSLNSSLTNSYDKSPDLECVPFFLPNQDMSPLGYYMKISLAILALAFIGSVFTLLFQIIMSCHNVCRNVGMKVIAFLFSLLPFILYLASPMVLFAMFNGYKIKYLDRSSEEIWSSTDSEDYELCKDSWCGSFYGTDSAEIPYLDVQGKLQWGPLYGWASIVAASFLCLVSSILTVCSARYRKHHHHDHIKYTKLVSS